MVQEKEGWRGQAERLFFDEHRKINEICQAVGHTRKYVSGHLKKCENYEEEKEYRKRQQEERRRQYQREWARANRCSPFPTGAVTADTLRREHDIAAKVLSSERY